MIRCCDRFIGLKVRAVDFAGETLPLRHELEISPEMYKPHLQDSDFVFEIRAFAEIDGPDPKTNQVRRQRGAGMCACVDRVVAAAAAAGLDTRPRPTRRFACAACAACAACVCAANVCCVRV